MNFQEKKRRKLRKIRRILRDDMDFVETEKHFNFLSEELKKEFNIVDTENVSEMGYDNEGLSIIKEF
jgi:hypothetical protein